MLQQRDKHGGGSQVVDYLIEIYYVILGQSLHHPGVLSSVMRRSWNEESLKSFLLEVNDLPISSR